MSDAVELLAKQVEEWEFRLKEARETVQVGEAILPSLREALDVARGVRPVESVAPAQPEATAPPASGSSATPTPRALRKSEDIEVAVIDCLESLPPQFEQSHVVDALAAKGLRANRSTLSQTLIRMAKAKMGFEIARAGKGRMPTLFENYAASE